MKTTETKRNVSAAYGSRISDKQAVIVDAELQKIEAAGGCITAPVVVDAARPVKASLHQFFTWDDPVAAELYREEEARHLIRSVVIVPEESANPEPLRAYVCVASKPDEPHFEGNAYISTVKAVSDAEYREQLLDKWQRERDALDRRYSHLLELTESIDGERTAALPPSALPAPTTQVRSGRFSAGTCGRTSSDTSDEPRRFREDLNEDAPKTTSRLIEASECAQQWLIEVRNSLTADSPAHWDAFITQALTPLGKLRFEAREWEKEHPEQALTA